MDQKEEKDKNRSILSANDACKQSKRKKKEKKTKREKKRKKEKLNVDKEEMQISAEPFSVDMQSIQGDYPSIKDIQKLILFTFMGPENICLPNWVTLNPSRVSRVVVVLCKHISAKLFSKFRASFPNLNKMFNVVRSHVKVFPFQNYGHQIFMESPTDSLLTVIEKVTEPAKRETEPLYLHAKDFILSENDLIKNHYLIPGISQDAESFVTIPLSSTTEATASSPMFAIDCEMCMTSIGKELTRISIVNSSCKVVYDSLVKPDLPIIDYLTRYSGISKDDLCDVSTTLKDVQEMMKKLIPADAILVGHSLEFDFLCLQFFHNKVIDTSVVYDDFRGCGFKPGLKNLAKKYLKKKIQDNVGGHCSIEDASTCMQLVQLKISKGPDFGLKDDNRDEISIFDKLKEKSVHPFKGVMVDTKSNITLHSGCADCVVCFNDEEVVRNVVNNLSKRQFIWSQLHGMDLVKSVNAEDIEHSLQQIDANIAKINEELPEKTLFFLILGSANTASLRRLREGNADSKTIKTKRKEIKHGMCFVKLV
ncbi:uncharacterized exonuclease C637.09-like isoform X2 [Xenia sp. Carnegie-2017]|uniref:uncharacterized exonuclease C637.09-like isoform X2 n=1 Tax=Xenia sp. Carnegie-2017 TaxID=2897299 RepID=UPI001F036BA2|nr:uncharacterized exonuclease C637.09-like isoform X2 [Xenia sp. Carnegie-2017]